MICKESGNIRQREDYLTSLLCLYALQTKVETSSREKTTYLHFSVSMICKESGNIRQREDYLPSLLCLYALQRKWKHQAERRLPSSTSLSLCSANKVEASSREKTTYLHFSVSMLCKEIGNIRQREDYLTSLLCLYDLQTKVETSSREKTTLLHFSVFMICKLKWKHQAERRLPTFTSLSLLCKESGNRENYLASLLCLYDLQTKVETSSREKTTYLHFSVSMICKESGNIRQR